MYKTKYFQDTLVHNTQYYTVHIHPKCPVRLSIISFNQQHTVNPYSSSKRSMTEKKTRKLRIKNIISPYEKKISNIHIKNAVDNKRVFF